MIKVDIHISNKVYYIERVWYSNFLIFFMSEVLLMTGSQVCTYKERERESTVLISCSKIKHYIKLPNF